MVPAGVNGEIDYEVYAARAKRRFLTTVGGIVAVLVASLYVPWAFVALGVLKSSVAEVISCISGLLLIGAWRGMLMKLADPSDAAPGQDRGKHMVRLLLACGAVLGTLFVFAIIAGLAGWVGVQGVGWGIALAVILGMQAAAAVLRRAIRQEL